MNFKFETRNPKLEPNSNVQNPSTHTNISHEKWEEFLLPLEREVGRDFLNDFQTAKLVRYFLIRSFEF